MSKRPASRYAWDTRRTLTGRSAAYLKAYIGRQIIHILEADKMYEEQTEQAVLSPTLRKALTLTRDVSLESDG